MLSCTSCDICCTFWPSCCWIWRCHHCSCITSTHFKSFLRSNENRYVPKRRSQSPSRSALIFSITVWIMFKNTSQDLNVESQPLTVNCIIKDMRYVTLSFNCFTSYLTSVYFLNMDDNVLYLITQSHNSRALVLSMSRNYNTLSRKSCKRARMSRETVCQLVSCQLCYEIMSTVPMASDLSNQHLRIASQLLQ